MAELGLAGRSEAAAADGHILLTENVADFARIATDHIGAGNHHPGVLVPLSSRFSRRPAPHDDRVVFLERTDPA